ncbi:MAG TPA: tetratricopeptide repeat protein [Ktedonobacteraceae bacterium]|nr:tetratricopeptide repeat protein [Ktedonobacteraceae bacterium]
MSRKKETDSLLSAEEHHQIEHLLAHYHQIAEHLHTSSEQTQAEGTLNDIIALSEPAQIALLKSLSKEQHSDAADIVAGMNALSPNKEVRKEARRSLIRLEATKIYPQWTPPITRAPAVQVHIANPPRLWKSWVSQTREEGEVELVLCWEQGYDYSEARLLIFQLDYWNEGIKEVIVDHGSKRRIDDYIETMRTQLADIPKVTCTLAEAKRLIEEALSVHTWRGTEPSRSYRNNLPTINNLLLQTTTDLGEDRRFTFINPELEEPEVVINFIGAWSMGDYGLAYDLLSANSNIRDHLSRDEWIAQHRAWADEAHPARLELGFVHERERSQSAIWLPTPAIGSRSTTRKEIEIGWSLELLDTPLNGTLQEMPMGTAINKETNRHWFWTAYTLIREEDAWRIQNITDEGAHCQSLSIRELQQRIIEYEKVVEERIKQRETNSQDLIEELSWRLTQLMHFYDALIALLPLDYDVHLQAYKAALAIGNPELMMVYLERMAQRFAEGRGDAMRRLASTLISLAYKYETPEMAARQEHFLTRAEETVREVIALEPRRAINHILLGELLINQERNDEAETEFQLAKDLAPNQDEESTIEAGLGNIAMRRERLKEAIPHYLRVAELDPAYPGIWFNLGFAHRLLGEFEAAKTYYQRAIQAETSDIRPYSELTAIFMNQGDVQQAREIAEQGVRAHPNSAPLRAILASVLIEIGDKNAAQQQLAQAEAIDPTLEVVQRVRQQMQAHIAKKR